MQKQTIVCVIENTSEEKKYSIPFIQLSDTAQQTCPAGVEVSSAVDGQDFEYIRNIVKENVGKYMSLCIKSAEGTNDMQSLETFTANGKPIVPVISPYAEEIEPVASPFLIEPDMLLVYKSILGKSKVYVAIEIAEEAGKEFNMEEYELVDLDINDSTENIGIIPLSELTDEDALEVSKIWGVGSGISDESIIFQVKQILTTNQLYNKVTNIPPIGWYRTFKYLESKNYIIEEKSND
jgi:hypothetical protein